MVALYCLLNLRFTYWFIKDVLPTLRLEDREGRINENEASVGRRLKSSAVAVGKRARRRLRRRAERAENRRNELFQPFPFAERSNLAKFFLDVEGPTEPSRRRWEMPTDVAARRRSLRARHRCARCSRRGGRTRHAAALERSTPPSRRKLLRCYSLHGVVWRRVEISRGEGCRASSGFASHVPGVAQDDHLQQGALTGRHGARELSMRARGERGNGASARRERRRALRRAGGRAHTLVGCVFRRFAGIEPSSARAADDA